MNEIGGSRTTLESRVELELLTDINWRIAWTLCAGRPVVESRMCVVIEGRDEVWSVMTALHDKDLQDIGA